MRTHEQIVADFGASKLFRALVAQGCILASSTPQRWCDRNRIPMDWWPNVAKAGAASLKELQASHRPRKRPEPKVREAA